ncbi:unnamed protein product [Rotaria socialis]|uniref:Uncharacterized protein n=1 Tax=Rotaria socialis TaxID=392032 RepID=A0A821TV15_9BILA|nr:unnamed protein product [Rotaria socialis]CAF3320332.1 unnamed protein product [Rotaria socialis]CAF3322181.1 unnamed protein product [Rotaria socialis]CAF3366008.1 unnamed protein product [Rotaria socialis]CAF3616510.1 unnamed protein product [Rotaria socialis]
MPSFKERFRSPSKYKKNKDTDPSSTDDSSNAVAAVSVASTASTPSSHVLTTDKISLTPTTSAIAAATSTTTVDKTINEHTGSVAVAIYHFRYSTDSCE